MYFVRDLVSPRTWLAFIHHFIGVLVGAVVVWIVVPGLVIGALGLPVAMIGMPVLGTTLRFTDWFARAERARFAVTLGVWSFALIMVTLPLFDWSLPGGGFHVNGGTLHEAKAVSVAVAGLLVLLAAPQVTRGLAVADAVLARRLLGPPSGLAARVAELELSRERVVDAARLRMVVMGG